jgi:hypothetical protein
VGHAQAKKEEAEKWEDWSLRKQSTPALPHQEAAALRIKAADDQAAAEAKAAVAEAMEVRGALPRAPLRVEVEPGCTVAARDVATGGHSTSCLCMLNSSSLLLQVARVLEEKAAAAAVAAAAAKTEEERVVAQAALEAAQAEV